MAARSLRYFRVLEIVICGVFGALGVVALVAGSVGGGVALIGFALVAVCLFEWRLRSHRRTEARVRAGLEVIGKKDLEAPGPVEDRDPQRAIADAISNPMLASMMARRTSLLAVAGRWKGREVEIGTAILASRDFDQLTSFVCVVDPKLRRPFRALTRGAVAKLARMGNRGATVPTGDPKFDEEWLVEADEGLCRSVLDAPIRARLLELQATVGWMQMASVEVTGRGLVLRWPGEMNAEWASHLRDLTLQIHDRFAAR